MLHGLVGFPRGPSGKESACQFRRRKEMWVRSLGQEDLLEKVMASILAWRIPRTEEPGGLQSMGSQRVGHDLATFFLIPRLFIHPSQTYAFSSYFSIKYPLQ